ncbi:MAG: GIY-YIG nuclease family protein [Pseudomonadota bacterium]
MKIFVYMLRCRDGSYYVGLSRDGLDKRLAEHRSGRFPGYTHSRRPVHLIWSAEFQWLKDAIACERRIKGWRREKKEALARGDYHMLPELARTARRPHGSTSSP